MEGRLSPFWPTGPSISSPPGGPFVIIAETYRGRPKDWLYRPVMTLGLRAKYLTPEEHRRLLMEAGYADVRVALEESKGWICAIGTRPEAAAHVAPRGRAQ